MKKKALARSKTSKADFLIVALDYPEPAPASDLVDRLGGEVTFYKVGMQLFYAAGPDFVKNLLQKGKKVFLDLKINDIPNTVKGAVASLQALGVSYLTLFTDAAAVEAAAGVVSGDMKLLNVTVLTSSDHGDASRMVAERAAMTIDAGGHGIICSGLETEALRKNLGGDFVIINPGIRPAGAELADQKRVVTPEAAWQAGANHIVVGRPITQAADPLAAAGAILSSLPG